MYKKGAWKSRLVATAEDAAMKDSAQVGGAAVTAVAWGE